MSRLLAQMHAADLAALAADALWLLRQERAWHFGGLVTHPDSVRAFRIEADLRSRAGEGEPTKARTPAPRRGGRSYP